MTHSFQRYTGAGNTFLVLNGYEDPLGLSKAAMEEFVRLACDYNTGAGADGMILVNQSDKYGAADDASHAAFRMDFYNPDGSSGMLCGNGARCAVRAAKDYELFGGRTTAFEVLGAINRAELLDGGLVRVYFQDPVAIERNIELELEGRRVGSNFIDVGSQHSVTFMGELDAPDRSYGDIETFDIASLGKALRWHERFQPRGANANFIEVREDGVEKYLRIRTFERGVEAETLACGTGCMSSAIVAHLSGAVPELPMRLLTQSGEFVTVGFDTQGNSVHHLWLQGSAVAGEQGVLTFDEGTHTLDISYV